MFAINPHIFNISITDPYLRYINPEIASILKYCYGSLTHIPMRIPFLDFKAFPLTIGIGGLPFHRFHSTDRALSAFIIGYG